MSNKNEALGRQTFAAEGEEKKVYYGGTITVDGRDLMTRPLAGETIELTRIVVGSGALPEGVEPIDVKELVAPVAEATSTVPTIKNNEMSLVVEYRNDMNGGLAQSFWLREFGIYAKTENTEEILLYYATLGDSPQPVSAFDGSRVDIRRYPVSIALALGATVELAYNPGAFLTAEEAQELINSLVSQQLGTAVEQAIATHDSDPNAHASLMAKMQSMVAAAGAAITPVRLAIGVAGWKANDSEKYPYYNDVECELSEEKHLPLVNIDEESEDIAFVCGLRMQAEAYDGYVRFWARSLPTEDITCTVDLVGRGGDAGGSGSYVLPAASALVLGGVKVGSGLRVDPDGTLSIDSATPAETGALFGKE